MIVGGRAFFIPLAFLIVTLPLTLLLAVITPLGAPPDEISHAGRAESLSAGQWLAHRGRTTRQSGSVVTSAGVDVDTGILFASEALYAFRTVRVTAADVARARQVAWTNERSYIEITPIAVYFPVLYVPAAVAIFGAKLAGASPFQAFFAARFMNVALFAALGICALLVARRGQGLMFCVLSLPMTVSLAASVSPDGLLIATSTLAVALLTRTVDPPEEEGVPRSLTAERSRTIATRLIALIGLAKFPYVVLAALLLVPVRSLDRRLMLRAGTALLAVLPGLAWIAYAMTHIAVPWPIMPAYAPGPLWPGPHDVTFGSPVPASQLQTLLSDPLRLVSVTWNTVSQDPWIFKSAVGVLGRLTLLLPDHLYAMWKVAGIAACIGVALRGGTRWRVRVRWIDAAIAILVVCLGVIAIYMSQYLTWTQVGAAQVFGPTGRYLLPLVPVVALAMPMIEGPRLQVLRGLLFAPVCIAALLGLAEVPRVIIEGCWLN